MLTDEQRLAMLAAPAGPVDAVIDTDTFNEVDDQFAISYALRSQDRIRVQALYAAPFLNQHSLSPQRQHRLVLHTNNSRYLECRCI